MSKGSQPATPNYTAAATAESGSNLDAARQATQANRVNSYTPYGSLTYQQDPNNPNSWSSTVALDPTQQKLLDQQNQTSERLGGLQYQGVNNVASAMGNMPSVYNPQQDTNSATQAILSRLNPQLDRAQNQLDSKLATQGITQGSEAYKSAQGDFGQQRIALTQAGLQGINLGMNQQNQTFTQGLAARQLPLNELNALRSGSAVTNPTFQSTPQQATTVGTNYLNAANLTGQFDTATNNANLAAQNGLYGGLFNLGTSALNNPDAISSLWKWATG